MAFDVTQALTGTSGILVTPYDDSGNVAPVGWKPNDASALTDTQQTALDAFLAAHKLTDTKERAA